MPSKVTGPARTQRWRERKAAAGLVQFCSWVPQERTEGLRWLIEDLIDYPSMLVLGVNPEQMGVQGAQPLAEASSTHSIERWNEPTRAVPEIDRTYLRASGSNSSFPIGTDLAHRKRVLSSVLDELSFTEIAAVETFIALMVTRP